MADNELKNIEEDSAENKDGGSIMDPEVEAALEIFQLRTDESLNNTCFR